MHSAPRNDGLLLETRRPTALFSPRRRAFDQSRRSRCLPAPDPSEIDTQSDTLLNARPCDSWTPSEARVRESLSKMNRWTPSDAGGSAETDLLIRVSLVRSQRGPLQERGSGVASAGPPGTGSGPRFPGQGTRQGDSVRRVRPDPRRDAGWVSVGVDHDTASFAVETLRRWWRRMGHVSYPAARRLLITADGGWFERQPQPSVEVGVAAVRRRDGAPDFGVPLSTWDEQVEQD